jgi:hypothetical protein
MKKGLLSIIIGVLASVIIMGLVIFAIEEKRSFLQILSGFILFILPFTFISSFASKIMSFILSSVTILFGYIVYKMGYHDVWIGIVQALVIGGAMYYYKIRTTTTFSETNYKDEAKKQR